MLQDPAKRSYKGVIVEKKRKGKKKKPNSVSYMSFHNDT